MKGDRSMGQMTDAKIAAWQKAHGIEPATGERLDRLEEMSKLAYGLIQVIELEKSGIRDGDGAWYGSDPLGGLVLDLSNRWQLLNRVGEREAEASRFLDAFIPA